MKKSAFPWKNGWRWISRNVEEPRGKRRFTLAEMPRIWATKSKKRVIIYGRGQDRIDEIRGPPLISWGKTRDRKVVLGKEMTGGPR